MGKNGKRSYITGARFSVGSRVWHNGRLFEAVAEEPYSCKDGSDSGIITWRTACKVCGEPVEFRRGSTGFQVDASRCPDCRELLAKGRDERDRRREKAVTSAR